VFGGSNKKKTLPSDKAAEADAKLVVPTAARLALAPPPNAALNADADDLDHEEEEAEKTPKDDAAPYLFAAPAAVVETLDPQLSCMTPCTRLRLGVYQEHEAQWCPCAKSEI
jgi:hypothetical protein